MPESTGTLPGVIVPQAHGGALRRGGGRPKITKTEHDFRESLRAHLPELVEALIRQARKGNVRAVELALAYLIGKPTDKVELSGPDGGPITTHAITHDDHEAQALRDAIRRELSKQHPSGEAEADPERAPVAGAAT